MEQNCVPSCPSSRLPFPFTRLTITLLSITFTPVVQLAAQLCDRDHEATETSYGLWVSFHLCMRCQMSEKVGRGWCQYLFPAMPELRSLHTGILKRCESRRGYGGLVAFSVSFSSVGRRVRPFFFAYVVS